jgi:hypothetical protein
MQVARLNFSRRVGLPIMLAIVLGMAPGRSLAAGARVDMELCTEKGFPLTGAQEWYKLLTALKVDGLQIRGARETDQAGIETRGAEASPSYRVTGILTAKGELLVPGGRFTSRDRVGISTWLTRLKEQGPAQAQGGDKLIFGLSDAQYAAVRRDLTRPVDFSTKGMSVQDLVTRISQGLELPLSIDRNVSGAMAEADKLDVELRDVSRGTVLAYAIRAAGLVLQPRLGSNRQPEYVVTVSSGQTVWPVGWPATKPERQILPMMFEMLNVELDDVDLTQVIEAIAERLKAPVLVDQQALARQKIDMAAIKVSYPSKQTFYKKVLQVVLFKARLKHEVRVDEADKPLLWITTAIDK